MTRPWGRCNHSTVRACHAEFMQRLHTLEGLWLARQAALRYRHTMPWFVAAHWERDLAGLDRLLGAEHNRAPTRQHHHCTTTALTVAPQAVAAACVCPPLVGCSSACASKLFTWARCRHHRPTSPCRGRLLTRTSRQLVRRSPASLWTLAMSPSTLTLRQLARRSPACWAVRWTQTRCPRWGRLKWSLPSVMAAHAWVVAVCMPSTGALLAL